MFDLPHLLCIDVEATCDAQQLPRKDREIIEFGAVVLDVQQRTLGPEFRAFVRPQKTTQLTDYCLELTSIRQSDVDSAPAFPSVWHEFLAFAAPYGDAPLCGWGDYDYGQIKRDCASYGAPQPFKKYIDASKWYRRHEKMNRRPSLRESAESLGLNFAGQQHRALDDAKCLAKVLIEVWKRDDQTENN